jgi:hypothetical protein
MAIIKCFVCSKEFERNESEIRRNLDKRRKTFCSRSCSGKYYIKNIPEDKKSSKHLKKGSDRDDFSPFRVFLKTCKMRARENKNKLLNLTLEDLKKQWEKQDGICPYTGWKMKIAPCQSKKGLEKTPDRASLDRIDSSKGYVKGNIQFVCMISQYAKNNWKEDVIFEFANAVNNYLSSFI